MSRLGISSPDEFHVVVVVVVVIVFVTELDYTGIIYLHILVLRTCLSDEDKY